MKQNIILLIVILFLFVIFGEIALRLFWVNTLRLETNEDGFYYFKENQQGHYDIKCPEIKTNKYGLRGNDFIPEKNKYIFLGDSFTFGWCLDDDETIPYYFQAINLANCGYGIEHMISSYDYYSELFYPNDTFIMIMIKENFDRPMIQTNKVFFWFKQHSVFIKFIYSRYKVIKAKLSFKKEIDFLNEEHQSKLNNFNSYMIKNNHTLYLVFYEFEHTTYSDKAKDFCIEYNLSCITNVYDYLRDVDNKYVWDGKHPSKDSNRAFAFGLLNR